MIVIENRQVFSDKGKTIKRKGSDSYFKVAIVLPSDTVENFEELDSLPPYSDSEYRERVQQLIALRYSSCDELAIQRQRDEKPEEFKEYYDYCERCKTEAKEQLVKEKSE